ncbi:MAG: hypothetical protein ACK4M7_10925, partial [Burkholderiales bacterium]
MTKRKTFKKNSRINSNQLKANQETLINESSKAATTQSSKAESLDNMLIKWIDKHSIAIGTKEEQSLERRNQKRKFIDDFNEAKSLSSIYYTITPNNWQGSRKNEFWEVRVPLNNTSQDAWRASRNTYVKTLSDKKIGLSSYKILSLGTGAKEQYIDATSSYQLEENKGSERDPAAKFGSIYLGFNEN